MGAESDKGTLHGHAWAFGTSEERNDAIWKNGVSASSIRKRARPLASEPKTDTTGGINRAIEGEKSRSSLGVSVSDETGTWRSSPEDDIPQVDETMFRDKRHVVRAFADVKPSDDLSISVGPELILKEDGKGEEAASESQPDSALGIGMKFKYDF